MTIQYQAGAAGLSWQANCAARMGAAERQMALYDLYAHTTDAQIKMTKMNSDQTLLELNDQANGQLASAIGQIAGSAAGVVAAGGIFMRQNSLLSNNGSETQVGMKQLNEDGIELENMGGQAKVDGKLAPAANAGDASNAPKAQAESKIPPEAAFWNQHAGTFASALTNSISAAGSATNASFVKKQAEKKALETLAGSLAGLLKSQGDLLSSALASNDTFAANADQALSTIISVSAVRG